MSVRLRLASNNRNLELERSLLEKSEEIFRDWRPAPSAAQASPPADTDAREIPAGDDDSLIIIEEADAPAADAPAANASDANAPATAGDDDIVIVLDDDAAPAVKVTVIDAGPSSPSASPTPDVDTAPVDAPQLQISLAGTSQLFVHLAAYVVESQVQSFLIALVIIGLLMMLLMRSVTLGLVVLLPNIFPILCTYGFMGYTGLWVDYLTSTIAVGALGVAVDGTIHIGTRFRRNRRLGMDSHRAAHDVMVAVGRALVVTSIVLVAGFLVLIPSMLASLATFGGLMALCLGLALVFDLVMTPAVLAWLNPGSNASAPSPPSDDASRPTAHD